MMWILGMIAVGIIATGAFLASGKMGEMPELVDDHPALRLPDGDFTADDVEGLHFAHAVRGYAPHQVDELMARVARTLARDPGMLSRPVRSTHLETTVFTTVGHGYHMGQVDHVMERLAAQLGRPESPDSFDAVALNPAGADPHPEPVEAEEQPARGLYRD